ncbi:MAG: hypothetical protein CMJ78_16505 [Planctomycetaceae bacterium]|nr:hypothetical protein [Planctomycetaceae bacterium]
MLKTCSDNSLQALIDADDIAGKFSEAAEHVESCEYCQTRIGELAADEDEWHETKQWLTSDNADEACQEYNFDNPLRETADGHRSRSWCDSMASQILAEPSHPEMLGRIGRYEVERVIGAGGMGVVFKVFDSELNRPAAVKVLAPFLAGSGAARKRFAREARAAAAVVDEHVVAIHNVESDGRESPFLVMQYVAGESLQARLDRCGPLEICEVLRIGMQTASGLAAAQAQGLVHRDVKPSNILLEEQVDRALLTDFGLARARDDASLTHSGYHPGTPQYMSPEQARGETVDQRSDLFSLGSVLYTMCTGRPPFRAETSYGVLRRITDEEPRPIRELNPAIPEWMSQFISKLMSKRPEDRFESASEVAELAKQCLGHVQQPTTVPLPKRCRVHKSTKSPILGIVALIAAIAFGLLGLLALQRAAAPNIAGWWNGEGWGDVALEKQKDGSYSGSYTDTFGMEKGELRLEWSAIEDRFKGTWREGKNRFGKISIRLDGKLIRGAWTTSKDSRINPGIPELSDLVWARQDPLKGNVALSTRGAKVEGPDSHPQNLLDGKTTGYHGMRGWTRSLTPATWTVTLPREYPLQQVRLLLYDRDTRKFRYKVEVSADGKVYEVVADQSKEWARSWQVHSFSQRPVRYIRLQCLDSSYNNRPREDGFFAVELEAYCVPPKLRRPVAIGMPLGDLKNIGQPPYMLEFSSKRQSYVRIPKLQYDGSHPITFEATVMSLYRGSIIGDFNGSGLGLDVANGLCAFHVNDGRDADNGFVQVKSKTSIGRNKLVHIAGIFDGRQLSLFVDGKLQGKKTIGEFNKSTLPFLVGADPDSNSEPTQFLNGFIDDLRVSKSARYDKDFAPPKRLVPDKDTLLLYYFDEGKGNVAIDASGNGLDGKLHNAKWAASLVPFDPISRLHQLGVQLKYKNGVANEFTFGNSTQITDDDLKVLESLNTIEHFTLIGCVNVTDAGFAHLRHLTRLQGLNLSPSNITDKGLENVKGMKNLWMLGLNSTRITDAGLQHLINNRKLTVLYLNNTKISDEGLTFLEQMKDMYWMDLESTGITDTGLAHLGHMSKLKLLSLGRTRVTDVGLPRLQRFSNLELLGLNNTAVTDAGLRHLSKITSLKQLILNDTHVTAVGLFHLARLKNLKVLQLLNTPIPSASIEELRKLLPRNCEIKHSYARRSNLPLETLSPPTPTDHKNHINSVVFSPDGKTIAAGDAAGNVILKDAATNKQRLTLNNVQVIQCIDFSPDGKTLATADRGSGITFWDVATGRKIQKFQNHESVVMSVAYSHEGDVLASAGDDLVVRIWDIASGKLRAAMTGHSQSIQEVVFSHDGKKLASVGLDGNLLIWDAIAGNLLSAFQVDNSGMGLTFSPDDKMIATANYPPKVQLVEVRTGKVLATLKGHQNRVRDVAFSPDGRVLASAGDDKTIRLWDIKSHQQIGLLTGHAGRVHDIEFSTDGKRLVSGSADKTTRVWDVEQFTSANGVRTGNYRLTINPQRHVADVRLLPKALAIPIPANYPCTISCTGKARSNNNGGEDAFPGVILHYQDKNDSDGNNSVYTVLRPGESLKTGAIFGNQNGVGTLHAFLFECNDPATNNSGHYTLSIANAQITSTIQPIYKVEATKHVQRIDNGLIPAVLEVPSGAKYKVSCSGVARNNTNGGDDRFHGVLVHYQDTKDSDGNRSVYRVLRDGESFVTDTIYDTGGGLGKLRALVIDSDGVASNNRGNFTIRLQQQNSESP